MAMSLATGEMYVTTEGDWVAGGQLVNAGDGRALEEGAGLLGLQTRVARAGNRAPTSFEGEVDSPSRSVSEARARLTGLEEAVVLLNEVIGREERDAMARELNAAQLAQEIERAERHLRVVADDAARLAQERLELEERRATALAKQRQPRPRASLLRRRSRKPPRCSPSRAAKPKPKARAWANSAPQPPPPPNVAAPPPPNSAAWKPSATSLTRDSSGTRAKSAEATARLEELRRSIDEMDRSAVDGRRGARARGKSDCRAHRATGRGARESRCALC